MSPEPLLSVRSLAVDFSTYGRVSHVLRNVSLDVPARRHVALVGESGCGKSVTMKAIMGILGQPPARIVGGEIRFDGRDLLRLRAGDWDALRGTAMSMVFQDPMTSLNPVFTIGDQMATILKYADRRLGRARRRRGRLARVHEVLAQVRMPDPERIAKSYPIMLSGGMRQRVLIAMALLSEPRLLIADEPGTALDVTTQAQILKLLRDLVEERGLALLMITHNLGVVREAADFVYVMYAGAVVEQGSRRRDIRPPEPSLHARLVRLRAQALRRHHLQGDRRVAARLWRAAARLPLRPSLSAGDRHVQPRA